MRGVKARFGNKGNAQWKVATDEYRREAITLFSTGRGQTLYTNNRYKYSDITDPNKTLDNTPEIQKLRTMYDFEPFTDFINRKIQTRLEKLWTIQCEADTRLTRRPIICSLCLGYNGRACKVSYEDENKYKEDIDYLDNIRISYDFRDLTNQDFENLKAEQSKNQQQPANGGKTRKRTIKKTKKNKKKTSRR